MQERPSHSIVPKESVASSALTLVVAIMAFLASLTLGGVSMVVDTARGWQSDIAREVTIQIQPSTEIEQNSAIDAVGQIVRSFDGVISITALDSAATGRLLEPWLGGGLNLEELPVPRLLMVKIDESNPPDLAAMAARINSAVPGAVLDNHRAWVDRLTGMAQATIASGLLIFALMIFATMLMVIFATRGAMAGNRHVIEVLHFVGADQAYIANQFQRHFLLLGLKGACAGGFAAIICFIGLGFWARDNVADPAADQASALFGTFSVGLMGYFGTLVLVFAVAVLAALTSRLTVLRHVGQLDKSGEED